MSRRLDVINLGDPAQRPEPKMMSSCETGGCGGGPEPLLPPPPTFGEVRVNGVEIPPELIAQEIQHHPAPDAETACIRVFGGGPGLLERPGQKGIHHSDSRSFSAAIAWATRPASRPRTTRFVPQPVPSWKG